MRFRNNKYKAEKIFRHGRNWPSKLELSVYEMLLMMERGGKLRDIKCQVSVRFHTHDHGKIWMIPDFKAFDITNNEEIYIEAKGMPTREYLRKKKAWAIAGPGKLYVYSGSWKAPRVTEVVIPKEEKLGIQRGRDRELLLGKPHAAVEPGNQAAREGEEDNARGDVSEARGPKGAHSPKNPRRPRRAVGEPKRAEQKRAGRGVGES